MCNLWDWYGEGEHVIFLSDVDGITYTVNRPNTWNEERADPYEFTSRESFMLQISRPNLEDQRTRYDDANFRAAGHKPPRRDEARVIEDVGPITFLEA